MLISILLPRLSGGGISRTKTTLAAGFLEAGASVDFVLEKETGELPSLLKDNPKMCLRDLVASVVGSTKSMHYVLCALLEKGSLSSGFAPPQKTSTATPKSGHEVVSPSRRNPYVGACFDKSAVIALKNVPIFGVYRRNEGSCRTVFERKLR